MIFVYPFKICIEDLFSGLIWCLLQFNGTHRRTLDTRNKRIPEGNVEDVIKEMRGDLNSSLSV